MTFKVSGDVKIGTLVESGGIYIRNYNRGGSGESDPDTEASLEEEMDEVRTDMEGLVQKIADHEFSALKPYVVNQQKASQLIKWMHQRIDSLTKPKMKLQVVRALYEGGYFTTLLPHAVYCEEFGQIPASSYSGWMGVLLKYSNDEMDSVLEDLPEDIK